MSNNLNEIAVTRDITKNQEILEDIIRETIDIVYYRFKTYDTREYLVVYFDDIINKEILDRDVIGGLIANAKTKFNNNGNITVEYIKSTIHFSNIDESMEFETVVDRLLAGDVIIFTEGLNVALCLPSQGWQQRGIIEPDAEIITKGPREGFVETLKTNRSMIRRKLKNPDLVFESLNLGKQSKSDINIVYIAGIVNETVLSQLKSRLEKIDIDAIIDSGYIEELIKDERLSPFNTVGYTERPDVVVSKILEGRIAVLCSGTPIVLTVPFLFVENLQANEDYYSGFIIASINRMVRFTSFLLTIFIPGLYVAIATNHHELIPTKLLFSFIASRVGVPFPTIIEVLAMILIFELLRESGLRLPKGLGQTVSIVGALVLGQAAVEAKFLSAPVVIIIALTAITSFIFYKINGALIIARVFITILGAMMGLYGVTLGAIAIFLHLYSIKSFGVPYMSYIASTEYEELKDTVVRGPWWKMKMRPRIINFRNVVRNGNVEDK